LEQYASNLMKLQKNPKCIPHAGAREKTLEKGADTGKWRWASKVG